MSNLKRIRIDAGLTQSQLAEASGVNARMIQHYEQGAKDINAAGALTVYKLAQALDCTVEDLLENVEKSYGEWFSIGDWLLECSICGGVIEDKDVPEYPRYCEHCGKEMSPFKK